MMEARYRFVEKKVGSATIKVYNDRPQTVFEMFHKTVETYPARDAIRYGDIILTYADLDRRVDELASFLEKDGRVGKGDRVAVFLRNDATFPTAFLAISKIGAISVVLNTRLTKPELVYQLELTKPVAAIVDSETWNKELDELVKLKVESGSLAEMWGRGNTCSPAAVTEEDVHTILFTSGTTGKPKGVRIIHRNFIHSAIRLEQYMELLGVSDPAVGQKTLIVAPLFHVMALQEQFLPCMKMGNTVVMLSALNIKAFLELVEKEKVDYLVGSPAIYRILLGTEDTKNYDLSSIKVAGFGAAPMSPDLMKEMKKAFVNAKFFNGFGLTEASVSLANINGECTQQPTSIGHPSLGCEAMIVDENMKEVGRGSIGEIAVKGSNVADGYYDNPLETKKVFRDGWFLTGDLGRIDEKGFFYVVSRKKDMINRGGENVYPVEVENIIYLHPKVLEVAVYGVQDKIMGEKVAAAVVAVPGTTPTAEEIKAFCEDKLAKYKIPEYIIFTASLPKNAGGKVIKEQLPQDF
ncbi:MAG TPA: class I adenylate-forming enzyme family protein [Smithellaceae bacterium]|nr:class I adenylate-forming enzyme family protein [Smithellaceae bacterium]HOM69717.1 class I adenylate-forming enzyme family protein [Smithellaceae bacterium]HOS10168.1 class I adenylate-forming enzyme family protein [Smithellaceae bacterium]HPD49921.1 class I adenylate-forming enzyme family protein [Smithellaceae bacterium]HPL50857.1 class I adenylate-forming enzyme family protein [Smithellaceae bacterium]